MKLFVFAILLLAFFAGIDAKIYPKCELVRALFNAGILKSDLPNWVCLVQAESNFNSGAVGGPNSDKSFDYGIFQINSKFWCKSGAPGGDCNLNCKSLTNDDITDDIKCAKIIYKRHGFNAWYGWKNKCVGKPLPGISECGV